MLFYCKLHKLSVRYKNATLEVIFSVVNNGHVDFKMLMPSAHHLLLFFCRRKHLIENAIFHRTVSAHAIRFYCRKKSDLP